MLRAADGLQISGEPLVQRADDNEISLRTRLGSFHKSTVPVSPSRPILNRYSHVLKGNQGTSGYFRAHSGVACAASHRARSDLRNPCGKATPAPHERVRRVLARARAATCAHDVGLPGHCRAARGPG